MSPMVALSPRRWPAVRPRIVTGPGVGCHQRVADDGRAVLALVGYEGPLGDVTVRLPQASQAPLLVTPGAEPQALATQTADGETLVTLRSHERLALITWQQ